MGFGRKADPEPGRCRRTDGKKWRCSKEAHPDSKYCERHMHRGRNRSRKPVEINNISSSTNSSQSNPNSLSPLSSAESYPFLSPDSSSSRPPGSFLSPQNNTTHHLFLNSAGSYSQQTDKDYSYARGVRNEVDERSLNDSFTPLTMSSPTGYPQLQFRSPTGKSREQQQQQQQQQQERHCFILGTDFKSSRPITVEREEEEQKPFHHFFGEWQPKSREYSWLDAEGNQSSHAKFTTTQLSISMPPSKQEFYGSKSTFHTDG